MARGRKGDSPKTKGAKRSVFRAPDNRKRRKLAFRSVEDRAALLASIGGADGLLPPQFLAEAHEFDGAIEVWRELAPDLQNIGALTNLDRYTLAMYCVHMADWIEACRDIKLNGAYYLAKAVAGGTMERLRPSVKIRELAERHIIEIGERFGLNPSARYKMLRDEAIVASQGNLPFDKRPASGESTAAVEDPVGLMKRHSSEPPKPLPN